MKCYYVCIIISWIQNYLDDSNYASKSLKGYYLSNCEPLCLAKLFSVQTNLVITSRWLNNLTWANMTHDVACCALLEIVINPRECFDIFIQLNCGKSIIFNVSIVDIVNRYCISPNKIDIIIWFIMAISISIDLPCCSIRTN